MRFALVLMLVACDAGQARERGASPLPAPAARQFLEPDPWAVTATATTTPPAVKAVLDPDALDPDTILIRWTVYPPDAPVNGEEPSMLKRVRLGVALGGVGRTIKLPSEFGSLQPYNQVVCGTSGYPLEKGELAKITFYEGGAGGFFVKRSGDVLTVSEWSQTDGACEDPHGDLVACPRSVKQVARIPVKAKRGAKVVEEIVEVDDRGEGTPLDCGQK